MAITKIIGFFLPALGNEAVAKARARELPSLIAKTTGCRELSQTVEDAFEVCGNSNCSLFSASITASEYIKTKS
jgi:hypothetical protein